MRHTKLRAFLITSLLPICFSACADNSTNISTWNVAWLTSNPSNQFPQSHRTSQDYVALSQHFASMQSDIVAFQEINDERALKRIIGSGYQVYFSQRAESNNRHHQFDDINQYTAFAVKNGITIVDKPDVPLDSRSNSKLRFGTYIILANNQPIHLLSVHLKARCSGAFKSTYDCKILKKQGELLNEWIREREKRNQRYLILGDFNHNLNFPNDWLWQQISTTTNASLATKETKAICKVKSRTNPNKIHRFRSLIDHMIISERITLAKPRQFDYSTKDVLRYQLSDHCPVSATLLN